MSRDQFVRVTSASTQFEAEAFLAALRDGGITAFTHAHGQQASDQITSATMPWWEVLVPAPDLERASVIVVAAAAQNDQVAREAEGAALAEYQQEPPAPGAAPAGDAAESGDDLRPESVRLAGLLHFGLLAFTLVFTLAGKLGPAAPRAAPPPTLVLGEVWGVVLGYALAWGPDRGKFWRRVRALALLRLVLGALLALFVVSAGAGPGLWAALAEGLVAVALVWPLGPGARNLLVAGFVASFVLGSFSALGASW